MLVELLRRVQFFQSFADVLHGFNAMSLEIVRGMVQVILSLVEHLNGVANFRMALRMLGLS